MYTGTCIDLIVMLGFGIWGVGDRSCAGFSASNFSCRTGYR